MKNTTNTADMTNVSEWGGFILDEARKKRESGEMQGMSMVITAVILMLCVAALMALPLISADGKITTDMLLFEAALCVPFFVGCALFLKQGIDCINTARENYKSILCKARAAGGEGYRVMCRDVTRMGGSFGGFYCGSEWFFCPCGLLCRWEEIRWIHAEFFYPSVRSYKPFDRAVISISTGKGKSEKITVSDDEDMRNLNNEFDRFAEYVKGKGVQVKRNFI